MLAASPAQAQVYKCTNATGKVVYSDSPCVSGTQILTDILPPEAVPAADPMQKSVVSLQIDAAVRAAIAQNDLDRARALATTNEHWLWIAAAQNNNALPVMGRTEADLSAEQASSQECQQAKRSLELEADASFVRPDALSAKKSLMRAACGIREPIEVVNDQPYSTFFPYAGRRGFGNQFPHRPPRPQPVPDKPAISVFSGPAQ